MEAKEEGEGEGGGRRKEAAGLKQQTTHLGSGKMLPSGATNPINLIFLRL